MVSITKDYFSIRQICESGQCFRLERVWGDRSVSEKSMGQIPGPAGVGEEMAVDSLPEVYALTARGRYLEIRQKQDRITFGCTEKEFEQVWKNYFDLDGDYEKMIASIDRGDGYLQKAAACGSGIRILRQDLWEMVVSFIISQQNNIRRIRKCIDLLCKRYGEKKWSENGVLYYDFPTAQALAAASLEELRACNLGYRSRYIHETAVMVAKGEVDLDEVKAMEYEKARTELLRLCGVGVKVADCICLFALHHTQAFPVDTHINRVLTAQYPDGFPFEKYKGYQGTMQQYLFYYDLTAGRGSNASRFKSQLIESK